MLHESCIVYLHMILVAGVQHKVQLHERAQASESWTFQRSGFGMLEQIAVLHKRSDSYAFCKWLVFWCRAFHHEMIVLEFLGYSSAAMPEGSQFCHLAQQSSTALSFQFLTPIDQSRPE